MGRNPERRSKSPNPGHSRDRRLQPAVVNMECLVIACQHQAVNTSLLLAHTQTTACVFEVQTARRSTRVKFG
jgi:hypothetical protein